MSSDRSAKPILELLQRADPDPRPIRDSEGWWIRHLRAANRYLWPIDRTLAAAVQMDRLAYVYASARVEALAQLVPLVGSARAALCGPEGDPPPRLEADGPGWRLSGTLPTVLFGSQLDELLVVARPAADPARRLLIDFPARRAGVHIEDVPTRVAPELPRGRVRLEQVAIAAHEILPGDVRRDYLRPYGFLADVHLHAALAAYLYRLARAWNWPRSFRQELLMLVIAARGLADCPASEPGVDLGLGGLILRLRLLLEEQRDRWDEIDPVTRRRWNRDRALLDFDRPARVERLARAWEGPLDASSP